jgi:hypothetical protein
MKRFKIHVDISSFFKDISHYKIRKYSEPFLILFINAQNPDDAFHQIIVDIIEAILKQNNNLDTRIFCRSIKHLIRFDKVYLI